MDPPYVGYGQGHYDGYMQEDFDTLLALLGSLKGRFLLSSFRNETLDRHIKRKGWHSFEIGMYSAMTSRYESKRGKVEVLTANYPIEAADKPSRKAIKEA
jgi:DNA adenine methylase